jgi:hypothetical protein
MRINIRSAVAAALFATATAAPGHAYTQNHVDACQGDALRLCGHVIPDHAKIHACLKAHRHHLSHACRAVI